MPSLSLQDQIQRYLDAPDLDANSRNEINDLVLKAKHDSGVASDLEDRFNKEMEFGTGGIRGVMAAGLNRMNLPNIRRVSLALGQVALTQSKTSSPLAIVGYDTRLHSEEFAREAARTLRDLGYRVCLGSKAYPTPFLCFVMRQLNATCGVIITASHNPKQYNGFKAYNHLGAQIVEPWDSLIKESLTSLPVILPQSPLTMEGIEPIDTTLEQSYIESGCTFSPPLTIAPNLKVLYTSFHGTGDQLVKAIFDRAAFPIKFSTLQCIRDGNFPTCPRPNPEEISSYAPSINEAIECNADVILANDPDADRIGLVAPCAEHQNEMGNIWRLMSGNDLAALTLDYLLKVKPQKGYVITTVVTSDFLAAVAIFHGLTVMRTLTGFKNIAKCMDELVGSSDAYVFSAEESYGMLLDPNIRDKDGVRSTLFVAQMVQDFKNNGQSVWQAVDALKAKVGFYENSLLNYEMTRGSSLKGFLNAIDEIRKLTFQDINLPLTRIEDYATGHWRSLDGSSGLILDREGPHAKPIGRSNVLKFYLKDGSFIALRPSGTEPKLKVYIQSCGGPVLLRQLEDYSRSLIKL